ncbi:DUF1624 domain-containing protein [Pseudemcibacter aquimaris]|uniref:DUF1624 domain-containing protein n=1 Tax=Pseudemcibacter aquimaris TaxID=2857064 RepID=UPI002010D1AE|nr:heparan-alpha-glucosaminide N-acetyltransferase domain-containing protein [Pseudemcibacter aquimaris]MCC3860114.1 heparan-alpha-glucosaminide N-acetyltransferase domain-containing protein [Pseudemcibacter aquimaris]WDU57442.1 DUF1624 domain-containing protein [Pseudemcibacter aquimaris]
MTQSISSNATDQRSYRLSNIDMVRGLVLLIMAIDHTRDFFMVGGFALPLSQPDIGPALYFTRWITHFCAPAFVFLAGTSIGLMEGRKTKTEIRNFLIKRGLWLLFVEIAIISTALSFRPLGEAAMGGLTIAFIQVIWVMGIAMLILAFFQYLGARVCLFTGIAIIIFQHLLDPIWPLGSMGSGNDPFWLFLHGRGSHALGPFYVMNMYPLLAWVGVMLLGYGAAYIFKKEPSSRDKYLMKVGIISIALFIILRALDIYGEPNPWQIQEQGLLATFFDFMHVSKYPPSFLFLLITLGPVAIICALADKWTGWIKDTLVMFGRVPFAFYVAHFYLIHTLSILFGLYQGFEIGQMTRFFFLYPPTYGTDLVGVYAVWILVIATLYPFCKWVAHVKARRKDWWLSYL